MRHTSLSELPIALYRHATMELDSHGSPAVTSFEAISEIDPAEARVIAELDVAFRDHLMIYHYFHFMELALCLSAVLANLFPAARIRNMYFGTQAWNNPDQNRVQSNIVRSLFRPARIIEGDPREHPSTAPLLLIVDRFGPGHREFNKFLEPLETMTRRNHPQVRSRIWQAAHTQRAAAEKRAIYITRDPPRTFLPEVEEALFATFKGRGLELERVNFANYPWEGQVQIARDASLMVGVHGNGLTNLLWMPSSSSVIEFFPEGSHHYDYQFFSEIAGLQYYGLEGKARGGSVYSSGSRFGPATGDINRPVSALPEAALRRILDVLEDHETRTG